MRGLSVGLSVLGLLVLLVGGLVACEQAIDITTPGCDASATAGGGGGGNAGAQGGAGAPGGSASAASGCSPGTVKTGGDVNE